MDASLQRLAPHALTDAAERPTPFAEVYRTHFDFVWRSARALGARPSALDDVVQEVFVIVHTRLPAFEWGASMRPWLSRIVLNVVRHHRRTIARKSPHDSSLHAPSDPDTLPSRTRTPYEEASLSESARLLHHLLDDLDDEKREVMVLADIQQLSVPEIAAALGLNLNTAYSRLRLARQAFSEGLARHRAEGERGRR